MKHVVMFSGGVGSWAAAKRVAERHGTDDLTLLFTDTKMEDPDLYRFLDEAAENVGGKLVKIAEGRTPWEVFFDVRFLGNSRVDPCSKILKRDVMDKWLADNCDPAETVCHVGIDWSEEHRFTRLKARKAEQGWTYAAPLCDPPYLTKTQIFEALKATGIRQPRLYDLGFAHNNCGGFCIKAGQAHYELLLRTMPERYAYHETQEQKLRANLGKDVSMLLDRRGGKKLPMTLKTFRERLGVEPAAFDPFEFGGCGCMSEPEEASA